MSLEMTRVQVDLKGLLQRADRGVQFAWEAVQTPQGVVGLVLYLVDADTPGAVTSSSVGESD